MQNINVLFRIVTQSIIHISCPDVVCAQVSGTSALIAVLQSNRRSQQKNQSNRHNHSNFCKCFNNSKLGGTSLYVLKPVDFESI